MVNLSPQDGQGRAGLSSIRLYGFPILWPVGRFKYTTISCATPTFHPPSSRSPKELRLKSTLIE